MSHIIRPAVKMRHCQTLEITLVALSNLSCGIALAVKFLNKGEICINNVSFYLITTIGCKCDRFIEYKF